jgi:hypothetical protein
MIRLSGSFPVVAVAAVLLGVLLPLVAVAVASLMLDQSPGRFTRDVALLGKLHPLMGFLSSLSVLGWAMSSAIWLFSSFVMRARSPGGDSRLMLHSGLLSLFLCFDDFFMVHEFLAPRYLGMPEKAVYGALALAMLLYLWTHRKRLLQPEGLLLFAALGALGSAVLIDAVLAPWMWRIGEWNYLIEDGLKWLGICLWLTFAVAFCASALRKADARAG